MFKDDILKVNNKNPKKFREEVEELIKKYKYVNYKAVDNSNTEKFIENISGLYSAMYRKRCNSSNKIFVNHVFVAKEHYFE